MTAAVCESGHADLCRQDVFPGHLFFGLPQPHAQGVSHEANASAYHNNHMYRDGYICFLHPNMWNPGRHTLTFVLRRVAKWLNKYDCWVAAAVSMARRGATTLMPLDFGLLSMTELRTRPGEILDRVADKGEAFIIERNGERKACLVPLSVLLPDISPARIADEIQLLVEHSEELATSVTESNDCRFGFRTNWKTEHP